jgi:hypothetical protein
MAQMAQMAQINAEEVFRGRRSEDRGQIGNRECVLTADDSEVDCSGGSVSRLDVKRLNPSRMDPAGGIEISANE